MKAIKWAGAKEDCSEPAARSNPGLQIPYLKYLTDFTGFW